MSDPKQPRLELQLSSPQALVRRMNQQLDLVARLLAEADAAHALVPASITNSLGMKMLWCPAGVFLMGSPKNEKERRENENQVQVRISRGFWMARTPVTQGQWQALMGNNPSWFQSSMDLPVEQRGKSPTRTGRPHFIGSKDLPVEQVSWDDAVEFCTKLNAQESLPSGYRYALPTEAQWEYACRAGTTTPFHFGSTLNGTAANCDVLRPYGTAIKEDNYFGPTTNVGCYPSNAWGLHDMHGNVWEWCADWYGDHLLGGTDPMGPAIGTYRVQRGGAWGYDAAHCRAATRSSYEPGFRYDFLGFRPALVPSR